MKFFSHESFPGIVQMVVALLNAVTSKMFLRTTINRLHSTWEAFPSSHFDQGSYFDREMFRTPWLNFADRSPEMK